MPRLTIPEGFCGSVVVSYGGRRYRVTYLGNGLNSVMAETPRGFRRIYQVELRRPSDLIRFIETQVRLALAFPNSSHC